MMGLGGGVGLHQFFLFLFSHLLHFVPKYDSRHILHTILHHYLKKKKNREQT